MQPKESTIWIASFDIGKKNFAFGVEEVDVSHLGDIPNIPKHERYYKDGTPTIQFKHILGHVFSTGKMRLLDNVDLTVGCDAKARLDPRIFVNMTNVLDKYKDYWQKCTSFVIEQQMNFGTRKNNVVAQKLAQHCYSYFIIQFSLFKIPIEFPAYNKTRVLGAPKSMTKPERKIWAVNKAIDILMDRDDTDTLRLITSRKKRDDLGDVIMQLQAFKYLVFIDKNL